MLFLGLRGVRRLMLSFFVATERGNASHRGLVPVSTERRRPTHTDFERSIADA